MTANEKVFAIGRILAFRHACTDFDQCFIVENTFCRLVINVWLELKMIDNLFPIVPPSSPVIAIQLLAAV